MATGLCLLILLASLSVWQSGAEDACDPMECLSAPEPVCALNKETDSMALFHDECVLRCTNCRITTEFKKVNRDLCSAGTTYVSVCPDFPLNDDNEERKMADPDDGIMVVEVDVGEGEGFGYNEAPPPFMNAIPLPLLSMGSELMRRLVTPNQPNPPPPPSEGLSLIKADIKVDMTINMGPPPYPLPPAVHLVAPPPLALLPPPPPPPPRQLEFQLQLQQPVAYSAAPQGAPHPGITAAVATLVALAVASLHI